MNEKKLLGPTQSRRDRDFTLSVELSVDSSIAPRIKLGSDIVVVVRAQCLRTFWQYSLLDRKQSSVFLFLWQQELHPTMPVSGDVFAVREQTLAEGVCARRGDGVE